MTVLKTTEQLQQWEKLVPFLGLNQDRINEDFWCRARHYEVLPSLHTIYSNQLTSEIMRKLDWFNKKLKIGIELCGHADFTNLSHKELAEMPLDEIKEVSTQVMLAIHDRYSTMEQVLTLNTKKSIESFDIDARIDVLQKQSNNDNDNTDWHGLALLSFINDQVIENLDIDLDDIETVAISCGDLFINGALTTSKL